MAILPIKKYPDPALSKPGQEVTQIDEDLRTLARDMVDTMYHAPGIGLAAPQVGQCVRLVVIDVAPAEQRGNPLILFNPRIVERDGKTLHEEGCLSVPGFVAEVERAESITVEALDLDGNPICLQADNLLAVCLQHELDHLDGKLFLDRLSPLKRALYRKRRLRELAEERGV